MSCIQKEKSDIPHNNKFIHINEYNKLLAIFQTKSQENAMLLGYLQNIIVLYESIKLNKKGIEKLFTSLEEINKYFQKLFKSKEDSSTNISSYENLIIDDFDNLKQSSKNLNSFNSDNKEINQILKIKSRLEKSNEQLIKKIEEMESSYSEINANFVNLVAKYKILKEEKNKVDDHNIILLDQIGNMNSEYNNILFDINDCHVTIERFKEIDKSILNSVINSFFLYSYEKKKLSAKESQQANNNNSNSYILCEPVPTFVKFINKYTK